MKRPEGMSLREAIRQRSMAKKADNTGSTTMENGKVSSGMARVYRIARKSGALNLTSRELRQVPDEIFRLTSLIDDDEKTWECEPLRRLDLSYNEIATLPPQMSSLEYLTSLKARHNKIETWTIEIFNLKHLTSLDLGNNLISGCVPKELGLLDQLKELSLANNAITMLPSTIQNLQFLEILHLENNQLEELPTTFGKLMRLHSLTLNTNNLGKLPSSFSMLVRLRTLDLRRNKLQSIDNVLLNFSLLHHLDLRENRLTICPELPQNNEVLDQLFLGYNCIADIPEDSILRVQHSLTVLDLRDNKLSVLPTKFPLLYNLKTLDLSNNDLHELSPGLGYLKHLNHFVVDGNPLRSIKRSAVTNGVEPLKKYLRTRGPPMVGVETYTEDMDEYKISQLEQQHGSLDILESDDEGSVDGDNQFIHLFREASSSGVLHMVDENLSTIPRELMAPKYNFAHQLTQLNLSKNPLRMIPNALGHLKALHSLTLEDCGLVTIDASINSLPRLQIIRLRKNMLTAEAVACLLGGAVPQQPSISIGQTLLELDLRHNLIAEIPEEFAKLKVMDTLLLSNNRLQSLSGFQWSKLKRLTVLSVSDNQLEDIGSVYEIPLLTSLSLENNNLKKIPDELGGCENLSTLYIAGNPQRGIRMQLVNSGTQAVLSHLRRRLAPSASNQSILDPVPSKHIPTKRSMVENGEFKSSNTFVDKSSSPSSNKRQYTATTLESSTSIPPISNSNASQVMTAQDNISKNNTTQAKSVHESSNESLIKEYDAKITQLENELDDFSLTNAKKFALKKEIAMVRSKKIRCLRATQNAAQAS